MTDGTVRQILEGLGLSDYSSNFEEQGYDDIYHLRTMTSAEVDVMMTEVEMSKPGHRGRFKKWHLAQAATLQTATDQETGHMHSYPTSDWQQPYPSNYFVDLTGPMTDGTLWQILEGLGLSDYSSKFEEQGYDDIYHLRTMTIAEVDAMMTEVEMSKPGHRGRFKKWHLAQAATLQTAIDEETGHMHSYSTSDWQQPYPSSYFVDLTVRHAIAQYQHWLEYRITEFLWLHQNHVDTYCTIAPLVLRSTREKHGTRAIQNMIRSRPANDNSQLVVEVLANNVETLILHPNAIFVFKECLMLAWQFSNIPALADLFISKSFSTVMSNWQELVRGRSSGSTYKVVMWMTEFMYIKDHNDNLLTICQEALEDQQHLRRSCKGHHILQHTVLFAQKAMTKASTDIRKASWKYIRTGFITAASEAIRDHSEWSGYTSNACHFINKCLELIASDPTDDELQNHRAVFYKILSEEQPLLRFICRHKSGQYTAKRLYEMGDIKEKNDLAKEAHRCHCAIERPDMRPLDKFKGSMFMPDHAYQLRWPDPSEITGYQ